MGRASLPVVLCLALGLVLPGGCDLLPVTPLLPPPGAPRVERVYPAAEAWTFDQCTFASPLAWNGRALLVVDDALHVIAPASGAAERSVTLPAPEGERAFVLATPTLVGDTAFVGYHTTADVEGRNVLTPRLRHRVVGIDLQAGAVHPDYPPVDLEGETIDADGEAVLFRPATALMRSAIVRGTTSPDDDGRLYITFGNAVDIQPWHGFAFELDVGAWRTEGASAAVTAMFVTTPEADCGQSGVSGSRDRRCGGGLWAPSGPLVVPRPGAFDVILAPGNGQLDLARDDFANTLIKTGPGLSFDPGCDAELCAGFDPDAPARACVESCANLFIPRMPEGETFPEPPSGVCEGLTLFECWQELDYIGGSTPAFIDLGEDLEVLLYPTKDGAAYLVDANHLGTMYDRLQLVNICGGAGDLCRSDWAGMIVTRPEVTTVGDDVVALIPTFMPDESNPAGVVAVNVIVEDGAPRLERRWEAPPFDGPAAVQRFRGHPTRVLVDDGFAWVVDTAEWGWGPERGRLLAIRLTDGEIVVDQELVGRGMRFLQPLPLGDLLLFPSCRRGGPGSFLEAYRVTR